MISIDQLIERVSLATTLLTGWHLRRDDWCVLDGPAIRLHNHTFDDTAWRDHLNIYVLEEALPWRTTEREQTIPPALSTQMAELVEITRRNVHLHLVPAGRYYQAGFERTPVVLASGESVMAATLRGCSQVWSYKSVEVIDRAEEFIGDVDRIVAERQVRLAAALAAATDGDVQDRIRLLQQGYDELKQRNVAAARAVFLEAAGSGWSNSDGRKEI